MRLPRPRVTLGVMMALILVLGAVLGWVSNRAREQRRVVEAIRQAGGSVLYDWEVGEGYLIQEGPPTVPSWLVKALGIDYFGSVVDVNLTRRFGDNRGFGDAELAQVARLGRLETLNVRHLDDGPGQGLAHLAGLSHLRRLYLHDLGPRSPDLAHLAGLSRLKTLVLNYRPDAPVADLSPLAGLASLKDLSISGAGLSDEGLAPLAGLNLENLQLVDAPLTSAALIHLRGLTNLSTLNLGATRVANLQAIRNLPVLEELWLNRTAVQDEHLAGLEGLKTLQTLMLYKTSIGDAGLAHLSGMRRLKRLDVRETAVTPAGVAALQAQIPSLRIVTSLPAASATAAQGGPKPPLNP